MTEKPVGIVIPTWNPNEPRFIVTEATPYLSENRVFRNGKCVENQRLKIVFSVDEIVDGFNALDDEIDRLKNENEQLRQIIKENVFQQYREGSLTDLKFKAIAYDDIVKLEMSYESEPKVIVICKQGKKENVKSFCQLFIPFGVCYEIKEVIDDE